MTSPVNENDPRVKRTRQLLLQAFHELAATQDMRSISVQDITKRATLNRATFYAHFRDKDALVDAAFRGAIQAALAANLSPSSPLSKNNLRVLVLLMCDFINTTVRRCPKSIGDHHPLVNAVVQEELYGFILAWLMQQLPENRDGRIPPERIASVLSWSLFGAAVEWSTSATRLPQEIVAAQVVDLLMDGIAAALALESRR